MKIIFDENYSQKLAEGLNLLEQGNKKEKNKLEVTHIVKITGKMGTEDEKVVEIAGKNNGIIVTLDKDFKRIKHLHNLYKKFNVGVIYYKTSNDNIGYWNMVKSIITRWEEVKNKIDSETVPFAYVIDKRGMQKLDF